MLFEAGMVGTWVGVSALLHHAIFSPVPDKKKINKVFENVSYGFKGDYPKLCYKYKKETYTLYGYNLPYGLIDNPKLETILEKTLNKPVSVEMNGQLKIKVYEGDLKMKYDYDFAETKGWTFPIGYTLGDKLLQHDFDKIPHMTVAGMTRQGKTVLLKLLMAHLIHNHPDDVEFYVIDLKGGLEFGRYEKLKQVKQVASNASEAFKLLQHVSEKIQSDMAVFKKKGYSNVIDSKVNKRTFIITDEGAELTPAKHHSKEEKAMFGFCQHVLSEVCRVAGALGYRNIFCTQYPTADTLPRQIKQNSDAKISFRLPTEIASRVAIDEQGAEELECVGRAIYRTHEHHEVQVPLIKDNDIWEVLKQYECSPAKEDGPTRKNTVEFG